LTPIPIIDLFAGPGGLNEGFSRLHEERSPIFETIGSFEMEPSAIQTLTLRSAYRSMLRSEHGVPDSYYQFIRGEISFANFTADPFVRAAFDVADEHVHQVELGSDDDPSEGIIRQALLDHGANRPSAPWVLIGGPPCQAYSLAGRSRRANDKNFADDKKHYLYREYLHIIKQFAPPVFVMENVKGLLSSTNHGLGMFDLIKNDLEHPAEDLWYDVHSVVVDAKPDDLQPSDFIIKAEKYGIPQKRHRIILLGVRRDFADSVKVAQLEPSRKVTVGEALQGIPALRSGISPASMDSADAWLTIRDEIAALHGDSAPASTSMTRGSMAELRIEGEDPDGQYGSWILDPRLQHAIQHQSRSHMTEDLKRYWYAANRARTDSVSPKLREFPPELQPLHKNAGAESRPFEDRFRVQLADDAATTVVSHISKDGHYYIHPDPAQMRSLSVREAARLQTFPDNYFFMGNRTQQYHQVGNAVPPLLANKIAAIVAAIFAESAAAEI
jgi:DNA (cytosine-5)-methyltransferase 1